MTGQRLDRYLSNRHPEISRARWQEWIAAGQVRINGQPVTKPACRLRSGDTVDYTLPPDRPPNYDLTPEAIPIPIVYEDDHLLVVNKPRGLTVHPAPGHPHGTLVNALLAHSPTLAQSSAAFRPGIVHRLDKDTTGLLVVAKTDRAHARLSSALQRHALKREYLALVWSIPRQGIRTAHWSTRCWRTALHSRKAAQCSALELCIGWTRTPRGCWWSPRPTARTPA